MFKMIAFDADDTLWENEQIYLDAYKSFTSLLNDLTCVNLEKNLHDIEIKNIPLYGYGIKSFTLSMVETAIRLSGGRVAGHKIEQILMIGKKMLRAPVELLHGVEKTLQFLKKSFQGKIIVITKGDLMDQSSKFRRSQLKPYFHDFIVVNEKETSDYIKIIENAGLQPEQFIMIGNSLKSDILPVVKLSGCAVHIPSRYGWDHESVDKESLPLSHYTTLANQAELQHWLSKTLELPTVNGKSPQLLQKGRHLPQ